VATEPLSLFACIALLTIAIIACLWYVNTAVNVASQVFLVLWIGRIDKDHVTLYYLRLGQIQSSTIQVINWQVVSFAIQ
jgi:hypothetical protein